MSDDPDQTVEESTVPILAAHLRVESTEVDGVPTFVLGDDEHRHEISAEFSAPEAAEAGFKRLIDEAWIHLQRLREWRRQS